MLEQWAQRMDWSYFEVHDPLISATTIVFGISRGVQKLSLPVTKMLLLVHAYSKVFNPLRVYIWIVSAEIKPSYD